MGITPNGTLQMDSPSDNANGDRTVVFAPVSQVPDHLEDFTASGESTTTRKLVGVECSHEFDFLGGIFPLACRRIDISAAASMSGGVAFHGMSILEERSYRR